MRTRTPKPPLPPGPARGRTALAAAVLLALPVMAAAEGAARPDRAVLAAVGWLGWGDVPGMPGKGCTAVLVAPDLVLTAAHCVTADEVTPPPDPTGLIFAPGWPDVQDDLRHAVAVTLPVHRSLLGGRLHLDAALVRLDAPVAGAAPLPLAAADAPPDGPLVTVGYRREDPAAASVTACTLALADPTTLGLDCPAHAGFSGGPVLTLSGGTWHIAAIMVGRGRSGDAVGTYAVTVPADLRAVIEGR